jgi:cytochrome P450
VAETSTLSRPHPGADLSDPSLYSDGDPVPIWARLRRTTPVSWHERGYWSLVGYRDIVGVYKDTAHFTSERGMQLDARADANDSAAGRMLIVTDPPRHAKIRRIISSTFTARTARRLEHNMRATVIDSLDAALAAAECDFTQTAARLPVSVVCDLLGVPKSDWDFMLERTMIAFAATSSPDDYLDKVAAHAEILAYYADLVKRRRREPGDDIVTALAHGQVDGTPLTDEEIFLNCDGLISGGNETTRHAAAGGLLAFIEAPDQWARLRDEPDLLDSAVDEVLRFTSPGMHVMRTATADVHVGGQHVREGERVALWNAAANRDEDIFGDGDTFKIDRSPNRHLTFGIGEHYCLGGALAKVELRVLLEELTRRVATARLIGPVRRLRSNLIWGIESLPVALQPAG